MPKMLKKRKLHEALDKHQDAARKKLRIEKEEEAQKIKAKSRQKGGQPQAIKPWIPYSPGQTVLLVGEGNFSFAAALVEHYLHGDASKMTATAFDSEPVAREKYPDISVHLEKLERAGATILYSIDATSLNKCKPLKGRQFDRIVFNYPHVGAGEKDETRNIRLNQTLLLGFFKSAASLLKTGAMPSAHSNESQVLDDNNLSEIEEDPEEALKNSKKQPQTTRGSILVTLRNTKPYTDWQVPLLAKKGAQFAQKNAAEQPVFHLVRSGVFDAKDYPGYAHRRTIGFQEGVSTENNEDTMFSAKHRKSNDQTGRTASASKSWQFALADIPT